MSERSKGDLQLQRGLAPRLRFLQFETSPIWQSKRLGSLAKFSSGGTPSKANPIFWNGNIPWISASSMHEIQLFKADHFVTPLAINNGTRIAKKGSLLILVRGSMLFNRVPICIAMVDLAFNQDVKSLDIDASINEYFLLQQLINFESSIPVDKTGIGAGKIETSSLESFRVFFPEDKEQKVIAEFLRNLELLITAQSQKLDALKTHKKGLMQQLFPREGETIPRLRFPEFRDAPDWEEQLVNDLGTVITGSTPSTAQPEFYGGPIQFVSPADICDSRFVENTKTTLTKLGFSKTRPIKANSVLFVCIGSTIGKIAQNRYECATNQQVNAVVPNLQNAVGFVYYALSSSAQKIASLAGKQAVPIVNKSLFSSFQLSVPMLPEQNRISEFLSSLDEMILAQTEKGEVLKNHKKGLMQKLFPVV